MQRGKRVCQLQRDAYGWFMQVIEYDFIGLDLPPCPDDINGFSSGDGAGGFFFQTPLYPPDSSRYYYPFFLVTFCLVVQQQQQIVLILINDSWDVVKSGSWVSARGEGENISIINILPFVEEL